MIDLIFRKSRPFSREELSRRQFVDLEGPRLFGASAEDVIIAKPEWARLAQSQRQLEDVAAILKVQWARLDRPYLDKWIAELGLNDQWSAARGVAGWPESTG